MPADLYLTAHINAKRVGLIRSNFLTYLTCLGLSGGCEHYIQVLFAQESYESFSNLDRSKSVKLSPAMMVTTYGIVAT